MATVEAVQEAVLLRVRVQPRASRNAIRVDGERIRITLTIAPVGGKANDALCRFVAKALGIRARNVTLASGTRSRDKVLRLVGVEETETRQKLEALEEK